MFVIERKCIDYVVGFCVQANSCAVIGVKVELGTPARTSPDAGKIEFFVDW